MAETGARVKIMGPSASKEVAALATTKELPQAEALNAVVVDNSRNFINLHLTVVTSITLSLLMLVIFMIIYLAVQLRVFSGICHWLSCCCGQCLEVRQEPVPGIRFAALGEESKLAARNSRL